MAVDIFISYPRRDRALVEPIKTKLAQLGLAVFFDLEGIDGGYEFPDVINDAVKTAGVVLGCWSPYAFTRRWVRRECRVGQLRDALIPVAIQPFTELDVHVQFLDSHYYDLTDFQGDDAHTGWVATLAAIERKLKRPISRQATREAAPQSLRPDESELSPGQRSARRWMDQARGLRPKAYVIGGAPTEHLPDIPADADQAYLAGRISQLNDDGDWDVETRRQLYPEIRYNFPKLGADFDPCQHAVAAGSAPAGRIVRCVKPGWRGYYNDDDIGHGNPVVALG